MSAEAPARRSVWPDLAGFTGCIAAGLALLWAIAREPAANSSHQPTPPVVPFVNVTTEAGLNFIHQNGAYGEKLLPESMGSGVAFFDFDNDGAPDLLFIDSGEWPGHQTSPNPKPTLVLYRNDGSGHFADVTAGSGLNAHFYGMGVACGDFDNDGWVDLFVTGVGENHLFKNLGGGKFTDVTVAAGVSGRTNDWSTCAAWVDYDNDGLLDLLVGHYVDWSPALDHQVNFTYDSRTRAYGPPRSFRGTFPSLFHNQGGGRFIDATVRAGLAVTNLAGEPLAKSLGLAPVDLDADGWIDLIIANDTVQNLVFRNEHNGTFREIGARSGIAFDSYGATRGAMGIDTARFRDDGAIGIAIGNFANEMNSLYVTQNDPLHFADEAIRAGFGPASQELLKFGLFFFDYDLDGRLDVLTANGHLDPDIERFLPRQKYRQPAQLFWNRGAGGGRGPQFLTVTEAFSGPDLQRPLVGRGSAFADIDGDGDPDVVLTQTGGPPVLLRNDQHLGHSWVRIRLRGQTSNRDAIGAWVRLRAGGRVQSRQVMPTKSYLSQSELTLTFGLENAVQVDDTEVIWPGGRRQHVPALRLNALNIVTETSP